MKKLLIMASLFYPQKNGGGPPISIMNVVKSVKDSFEIYIISKNHEVADTQPLDGIKNGWNTFDFGKVYYTPYGDHGLKHILRVIDEVSPDIIYENSFFSHDDMLPVCMYKKKHPEVRIITAPRGEFYPERLKSGRAKKTLYKNLMKFSGLLRGIYFQATGEQEKQYISDFVGTKPEMIYNVNNITLPGVEQYFPDKTPGELRLVFMARIHPMKNLLFAIDILKDVSANVTYDIYGSTENREYWEQCLAAIKTLPENIKVTYRGNAAHDDVPGILAQYHAFFMPTIGENYGHSIVEALLASRPVIISDKTPWCDLEQSGAGFAIALDDRKGFAAAIERLAAADSEGFCKTCRAAHKYITTKLDTAALAEEYKNMFLN